MAREYTQRQLLEELEPAVAKELDRHLAIAKEWMPHEYVPWTEGRNFAGVFEDGVPWDVTQSKVSDTARTALVVNLLTEDNLPSYHREIHQSFGPDGAWGTWIGRWTAEEGRHGMAIRDYLLTTRAVDPDALERERMVHMTQGFESTYELDMLHTVAYVSFQELATRISHRNTGKYTEDPFADQLLARISVDHRGLHPPVAEDRPGRDLRPADPPRRGAGARPAALEDLRPRGAERRGRGGAGEAGDVPRATRPEGGALRGEAGGPAGPVRRPGVTRP
jgi:hypothetical protein